MLRKSYYLLLVGFLSINLSLGMMGIRSHFTKASLTSQSSDTSLDKTSLSGSSSQVTEPSNVSKAMFSAAQTKHQVTGKNNAVDLCRQLVRAGRYPAQVWHSVFC